MSINRAVTGGVLDRDRRTCGINANGKHDELFLIDRATIRGGLPEGKPERWPMLATEV